MNLLLLHFLPGINNSNKVYSEENNDEQNKTVKVGFSGLLLYGGEEL